VNVRILRTSKRLRLSKVRLGGFTLIEVLAALLIAAVAVAYLVGSEVESARTAGKAQALRRALLLAEAKLNEVVLGEEAALSGTFEEPENWSWEVEHTTVPEAFGARKITVTVHYTLGGKECELSLERLVP